MNKYRAKTTTVDGLRFASGAEACRYAELKLLERAGEIRDLRRQMRYPLIVSGSLVGHYTPDFEYREGSEFVTEDVKGFAARDWPLRRKLFEALYGRKIRVIGKAGNRRRKAS